MLTGIDHLVIGVESLETAVASYRDLGFTVVAGGRHPGIGTHNALIAFEDGAYLELIAFYEPRPDHRWWTPLRKGGGLVDFCLQTSDLDGDTAALRRAGVKIGAPEPKSRRRPDGYEVRWVFSLPRDDHRGVAPFIIQDETPRGERVPAETRHPNEVTGVGALTVAVDDVAAVRRWYEQALSRPALPLRRPDVDGVGVRFAIGPHALDVVAPEGLASPLRQWLKVRGSSPYAASLRTAAAARGPLDPARTLGARLSYE